MNIADLVQMLGQNVWIYGGSFLVVLGVLVFVHEWGHYIIARMCGVRVEQFSIGFGKEIWGFNDKAGTRWKVSLFPLGGYVQLFGDTDPASAGHTENVEGEDGKKREMTEEEKKVAFYTKPVWQRAAIVFAGPAINYIFAIMILTGLYMTYGKPMPPATAAAVMVGSPAYEAGIKTHDVLLSIDGKSLSSFDDIRREMMVALDLEKRIVILRDDEEMEIFATPDRVEIVDRFGFKNSVGRIGIISPEQGMLVSVIEEINGVKYEDQAEKVAKIKSLLDTEFRLTMPVSSGEVSEMVVNPTSKMNEKLGTLSGDDVDQEVLFLSNLPPKIHKPHNLMTGIQAATVESYVMTRSSLEALWQMVVGTRSATELGGIIRIGAIAGDMAQQGIVALILLTALLSINLGFINLLPIPLLDGGHLTFYFIEFIRGEPIPDKFQEYAFQAGFIFLIAIMAFANLNDLYQLLLS